MSVVKERLPKDMQNVGRRYKLNGKEVSVVEFNRQVKKTAQAKADAESSGA